MNKAVWGMLRATVMGVVLAVAIMCMVGPAKVTGSSMEPTIAESDVVIINKISYLNRSPECGDIIVFRSDVYTDSGEGKLLVKRVVATEGDTVEIRNGHLYRNGIVVARDFGSAMDQAENMEQIQVQPGCVFVLGDNRNNSRDSRDVTIGQVDCSDIIGKVDFRVLPLNGIGEVN